MKKFTCGMCGAIVEESRRETHIDWEAHILSERFRTSMDRSLSSQFKRDEQTIQLVAASILLAAGIVKKWRRK